MSRINSIRRYTQSIGAKEICILLVKSDHVCSRIVADMLHHCRYEVFSHEREMDALDTIRERKDRLELVLTNVHRTYANRLGIVENIEKEFKLQIILMSPDAVDVKMTSDGAENGVTVYVMKSLSFNEINNLWANALAREKCKKGLSSKNLTHHVEKSSCSIAREALEDGLSVEKKPRIVWTNEMHQKFLNAIAQLGHDKAFPKKIVELMDVPGLTRENVASHLQKYRMCMKRAQEGLTGSPYAFTDPFTFNASQGNYQRSHWNPFEVGSRNATTAGYCRVYRDERKNILLTSKDSGVTLFSSSFIGFRLAGDGKSIEYGQNGHLGGGDGVRGVIDSCVQSPSASSVQHHCLREMGNDDSSQCILQNQQLSGEPPGTKWGDAVMFTCQQQQSSVAALLGIDQNEPTILTWQQPYVSTLGTDWDKAPSCTQPQSSVEPLGTEFGELVRFTCQQRPSSVAALLGIDQNKPTILTWQQPCAVAPPGANWDQMASFAQQQSYVASPGVNSGEPLRITCQQQQCDGQNKSAILIQRQLSAAPPGTDWDGVANFTQPLSTVALPPTLQAEPTSLTPLQPPLANANSENFSALGSPSLPPPEFCELGMVGDDGSGVFDDFLFDCQYLAL